MPRRSRAPPKRQEKKKENEEKDEEKTPRKRCRETPNQDPPEEEAPNEDKESASDNERREKPPVTTRARKPKFRGKLEDRTCPDCGKVFTSALGARYHIQKKVCQSAAAPKKRETLTTVLWRTLEGGERFSTAYGVVEVVVDATPHDNVPAPTDLNKLVAKWKIHRRKREEQLRKLYLTLSVNSMVRRRRLADISEPTQASIFDAYFGVNRLEDAETETIIHTEPPLHANPQHPANAQPDRMVECRWIADERTYWSLNPDGDTNLARKPQTSVGDQTGTNQRLFLRRRELVDDYIEQTELYACAACGQVFSSKPGCRYHTKSKVCDKKATAMKKNRAEDEALAAQRVEARMGAGKKPAAKRKRDTARKALVRKRQRNSEAVYPQVWMSLGFRFVANQPAHRTISAFHSGRRYDNPVVIDDESINEQNNGGGGERERGEAPKPAKKAKKEPTPIEDPRQVLADLEKQVQALIAQGPLSDITGPVYPSAFVSLGFKRPAQRKTRRKKGTHRSTVPLPAALPPLVQKIPFNPALTQPRCVAGVPRAVDPPVSAAAAAPAASHPGDPALSQPNLQSWEADNGLVYQEKIVPISEMPPMVDPRAFVHEILTGRYSSMRKEPEDPDITRGKCSLCDGKRPGPTLKCMSCPSFQHFACFKTKYVTKEPEPGDTFLCNRCVGYVTNRRARAEKRRVIKVDSDNTQEIAGAPEPAMLESLVPGQEVASVGTQTKFLKDVQCLLEDAQKRARQQLEAKRQNDLRRHMIMLASSHQDA